MRANKLIAGAAGVLLYAAAGAAGAATVTFSNFNDDGSPALFEPDCRSPAQMRLANAFCRYLELAETI